MARFYSSIVSKNNIETHRLGHRTARVECRSWDGGVRVDANIDENGDVVFSIYATNGSNGRRRSLIGEYTEGELYRRACNV